MVPSASTAAVMNTPQPEVIDQTADYLRHLHDLAASHTELERRGYIVRQLTEAELERKERCSRCRRALKPKSRVWPRRDKEPPKAEITSNSIASQGDVGEFVPAATPETRNGDASAADADSVAADDDANGDTRDVRGKPPPQVCKYHPGQIAYKRWTCCNTPPMSKSCQGEAEHAPPAEAVGELQKNWRFFTTPAASGPSRTRPTWRAAVSIDCEMGVAESGEPELIRVSVADYFSGATLLDSLVWPDVKMEHYNARFSGVSRRDMLEARRRRACLLGRGGARKAVWKYVGPDTVVVGHGANSDLVSLRWIHHRIVDTLLVEEAVAKLEREEKEVEEAAVASGEEQGAPYTPTAQQHPGGRGWSLKSLAHRRLGREIQKKGRGHDSVEDALAARDLLHWHIVNRVMEAK